MTTITSREIKARYLDLPNITVEIRKYRSIGLMYDEYYVYATDGTFEELKHFKTLSGARGYYERYMRPDLKKNGIPVKKKTVNPDVNVGIKPGNFGDFFYCENCQANVSYHTLRCKNCSTILKWGNIKR